MRTDPALVSLRAETLRALYDGLDGWTASQPGLRAQSWPEDDRRSLEYRMAALDADPSSAPYLVHVAVDGDGRILGRIGCHAAPTDAGEVEIGYFVRRTERGRGLASRMVDQFLVWLHDQGVQRVRATVRPDNEASIRILQRRQFVQVGTRIDDEDGLELVLERQLDSRPDAVDDR